MKEVENMETGSVIAYPTLGVWVVECTTHGFIGVSTDSIVDTVMNAHVIHAHAGVLS